MSSVRSLSDISRSVVVLGLTGSAQTRRELVQQFSTGAYTAISIDVLSDLIGQFAGMLTNEVLGAVCPPHLRSLRLTGCSSISLQGLLAVFNKCINLLAVDLTASDHLMHLPFFSVLAKYTPRLTSLVLDECEHLTSRHVQKVLELLPCLQKLSVSQTTITDEAFVQEGDHKCQLTHVNVSGCQMLTLVGIVNLTRLTGPTLQQVNLSFTKVDPAALWYLCGFTLQSALDIEVRLTDRLTSPAPSEVCSCVGRGWCGELRDLFSVHTARTLVENLSRGGVETTRQVEAPLTEKEGGRTEGGCTGESVQGSVTESSVCTGESVQGSVTESSVCTGVSVQGSVTGTVGSSGQGSHDELTSIATVHDSVTGDVNTENFIKAGCDNCRCVPSSPLSTSNYHGYQSSLNDRTDKMTTKCDGVSDKVKVIKISDDFQYNSQTETEESQSTAEEGSGQPPTLDMTGGSSLEDNIRQCVGDGTDPISPPSVSQSPQCVCDGTDLASDLTSDFPCITQAYSPVLTGLDLCSHLVSSLELFHVCLKCLFVRNTCMQRLEVSCGLTDGVIQYIADRAPNLQHLSMTECDQLTSTGIQAVCSKCPLTHLNLQGVCFIHNWALFPLWSHDQLISLTLAECNVTEETLLKISESSVQLRHLDLSWCEEIDVEESCDTFLQFLQSAASLQSLLLRQLPLCEEILFSLAESCVGLRELNLASVSYLRDSSLLAISLRCGLLEDLDVSWNPELTDVSFRSVLLHLIRLRRLCMNGVKQITSTPLMPIIADLSRWRRCQALLRMKLQEQQRREDTVEEAGSSSEEEFEELFVPHRSTSFAPCLRRLFLEYSDLQTDSHLSELVAVCRGTLCITDYYGSPVKPCFLTQDGRTVRSTQLIQ